MISNAVVAGLYHRPFATENDSVVLAEQGLFEVLNHARSAYDIVKHEYQPISADEMWELWITDVLAHTAEKTKPPTTPEQSY